MPTSKLHQRFMTYSQFCFPINYYGLNKRVGVPTAGGESFQRRYDRIKRSTN